MVVTSAALGGLAASCVAILAVDSLISDHADQRLRAATVTLAGELDEDLDERKPESVSETVTDENDEIVTSGIRLAVFEGKHILAGDAWMFAPEPGTCVTRRVVSERVRACASTYAPWTLVAAQPVGETWLYWLYALSALGAVVLGAGTGAVSSLLLSRWAVGPLEALSRGLASWRPELPTRLDLGPAGSYEEVEAIRRALSDLTARLQSLLEQAQRFAADAAHEIRTPLTALRAELELLAEESSTAEQAALERVSARVARLSALVDRLLILAVPGESLREGFEAVSLADLVEQVTSDLSERQRARVELDLADEGLVRGDAPLLSSLIDNALQNALKFAPDGKIKIAVLSGADRDGERDQVLLRVVDSGPGIPPELFERVFDPFYRNRERATSGYGLGLALIAHIALAHGGRAYFERAARGATLVVALPAWREGVQSVNDEPSR